YSGSSEGWMLRIRPAKRSMKASPRMRMYPAHTIQSGCAPTTAAASASSKSLRRAWLRASRLQRSEGCTRCSAGAVGRSLKTPTTSAARRPPAMASTRASRACRLLPRPEARTAIRFGRVSGPWARGSRKAGLADADAVAARRGHHAADGPVREAEAVELGADRGAGVGGDHQHEADAAVE